MPIAWMNPGKRQTGPLTASRSVPWLAWLLLASCGGGESALPARKEAPTAVPQSGATAVSRPDRGWLGEVRDRLTVGEYRIATRGKSLAALNRAQGLTATWTEQGLSVSPRSTAPGDPGVRIRATALGRGQSMRTLSGGQYRLGSCRTKTLEDQNGKCLESVERQSGGLVEWWENKPSGLQHGFVVSEPEPRASSRSRDWLTIEVRVWGARPELSPGASQAIFERSDGKRLHYAGLTAWDSEGRTLPTRMRKAARGLRLEIDDTNATYPIVVDPVLTVAGWTVDSNEADAGFEINVAGAGDVNGDTFDDVLVGLPRLGADEGRVFLYLGGPAGPDTTADWDSQGADAAGTAAAPQAGSLFGRSVAAAGDVNRDGFGDIIVGQTNWANGEAAEGRAYVFHGSAGTPPLQAVPNWVAEGGVPNGLMGRVAGAGDINGDGFADVVVGSPSNAAGVGRVLVYLGSAAGLAVPAAPVQVISAAAAGFRLGFSVASAGDVNGDGRGDVIVGASTFSNGQASEGGVFAYLGQADGTLQLMAGFPFETGQANAGINSVSGVGDVNGDGYADAVAGSPGLTVGGIDQGVVYFFPGSPTGLGASPVSINPGAVTTSFGVTVAGPGDVNGDGYADIAIGAFRASNGTTGGTGAVFLIPGSSGGPAITNSALADTILFGANASDALGQALGAAGDVNGDGYADVIAGAPGVENPENNEGRATIYFGSAETRGLRPISDRGIEVDAASAALGTFVAAAGDVNGDGFGDYAVAAPNFGGANNGTVFIYHGGAAGSDGTADGTLTGPAGAGFGKAVASAGDINGDGFGDLVVGAPNFGDGQAEEGRIFVYLGASGGITAATPAVTFDSNSAGALLGSSVGATDFNGDGLFDVLAGAPGLSNGQVGEGGVYLLRGSFAGFIASDPLFLESDTANARFGAAVAGAGDFNADGFGDVVVGAPGYSDGEVGEGRIYVYPGGAAGLSAPVARESDVASAALGTSVDGAGDADGNGFADVVAGAPGAGAGGTIYLFESDGAGLTAAPASHASAVAGANLGASVAGAGDLNGDGLGDVVAGAPGYGAGEANEGALYVFVSGPPDILPAMPSSIIEGGTADLRLGTAVAGVGDVNGDGVSDVVVGAPGYGNGQAGEGRALLHLGNTNGRPYRLRTQRPGAGATVQAGAVVPGSMGAFDITIFASGPLGITNVRLETEVKPAGTAFDGMGTVLDAAFTSTGLGGVTLTRNVTGLAARTRYHYRARIHYDPAQRRLRGRTSPWIYGGVLGDATGAHLRTDGVTLGAACTTATECGSGFCIDGVCCATACGDGTTNDCKACSTAAGGTMGNGICTDRAMGAACSDSNGCTTTDTCGAGGVCQGGTAVVCTAMSQCHDVGVCDPGTGTCSNPVKTNGSACSDGSMCTTGETCQAGMCMAGTPVVCTASDQCHDAGTCDPATGMCTNPPKANGAACSDGMMCTTGDSCQGGACMAGTPVVCTASDQCHDVGTCDPATGMCSNPAKLDGTACNDGNMCTTMDRCMAGACVMGGTPDCNDNNVCTTDTCVAASGCVNTAIASCNPNTDAGLDASTDATTDAVSDASSDRPDAFSDARDGSTTDSASTDARDGSADSRDGSGTDARLDAPLAVDVGRDTASTMDGASNIKRVGGGGGCDCDVGRGGRSGNVQAPMLLLGLGLIWMRRRSRKR
jgi:MYXO-CTERM domain-containing protein